jgi:hypothetical protein
VKQRTVLDVINDARCRIGGDADIHPVTPYDDLFRMVYLVDMPVGQVQPQRGEWSMP